MLSAIFDVLTSFISRLLFITCFIFREKNVAENEIHAVPQLLKSATGFTAISRV